MQNIWKKSDEKEKKMMLDLQQIFLKSINIF